MVSAFMRSILRLSMNSCRQLKWTITPWKFVLQLGLANVFAWMSLPIMDYKNQPIITPDSRQVSDNRMRCLVKNMAMFGLGISLYMGFSDDLPDEDKDKVSEKTRKKNPVKAKSLRWLRLLLKKRKNIP